MFGNYLNWEKPRSKKFHRDWIWLDLYIFFVLLCYAFRLACPCLASSHSWTSHHRSYLLYPLINYLMVSVYDRGMMWLHQNWENVLVGLNAQREKKINEFIASIIISPNLSQRKHRDPQFSPRQLNSPSTSDILHRGSLSLCIINSGLVAYAWIDHRQ